MNRNRRYTATILVVAGVMLIAAAAVQAATFTVTKTADTNDGVCNADCSLTFISVYFVCFLPIKSIKK